MGKIDSLGMKHIAFVTTLSGLTSSIFSNPFWLVNTRMMKKEENKSLYQTIKDIYVDEGISAFFKGCQANMFLVSNPIINYVAYEAMKKYMLMKNKRGVGAVAIFVIGCIAKIIATYATYPMLTIRI